MLLIRELTEDVEIIFEDKGNGKKDYWVQGICLQSNIVNRNNRFYPKEILSREVQRVNENYIKNSSAMAMGELGHPSNRPFLDMKETSHIMRSLTEDGDNFYGKAKILDTPNGKITKALMDEGVKFGFSSRGLAKVNHKNGVDYVSDNYKMTVIADLVADPSGPDCMAAALMENVEWIYEDGIWKQDTLDKAKNKILQASSKQLEEAKLQAFQYLLNSKV